MKPFPFVVLILVLAFASQEYTVKAIQIVFDQKADETKVIDVSCAFSDDYKDFWVYGCPTEPTHDIYPNLTGYWTACRKNCHFLYNGGLLPKPQKLRISAYIQGDAVIKITGKNNLEDSEFIDFGTIAQTYPGWCEHEIDLTTIPEADASVINFTLTSPPGGFAIVDKIIVDLGDSPLDPISIDKKVDEHPMHWPYDDCHHLARYEDFWAFGCPAEPTPNPTQATGYWSPCNEKFCKIEFETSPSVTATWVSYYLYMDGDAEIKLTTPRIKTKSNPNPTPVTLNSIPAPEAGGWIEFGFDISAYKAHKLNVVLERNNGTILLDSLTFNITEAEGSNEEPYPLPQCLVNVGVKNIGGVALYSILLALLKFMT